MSKDIAERFAREITEHEMTVLHDDGLYRHLMFRNREHGWNLWFDLITVPGALIFQGDGESFTFRRTADMFAFFRGPVGQINSGYWAEKLTSGREQVMEYQQDLLEQHVNELVAETLDDGNGRTLPEFAGLTDAIREHIIDELTGDESIDRKLVEDFRWYANPEDEFAIPRKHPDFEFTDVWEWDCRDYDWWFLWALHGIVWGIAQYDNARASQSAPAVVDVQLPAQHPLNEYCYHCASDDLLARGISRADEGKPWDGPTVHMQTPESFCPRMNDEPTTVSTS